MRRKNGWVCCTTQASPCALSSCLLTTGVNPGCPPCSETRNMTRGMGQTWMLVPLPLTLGGGFREHADMWKCYILVFHWDSGPRARLCRRMCPGGLATGAASGQAGGQAPQALSTASGSPSLQPTRPRSPLTPRTSSPALR